MSLRRRTRPGAGLGRAAACLALAASIIGTASLVSCHGRGAVAATEPGRVVVLTPPESAAPLQYRGAEDFVRDQAAAKGLVAQHAIFPDEKKTKDPRAVAAFIAELGKDGRVSAIVAAPAPEGTAEGFRRAREARGGSAPSLLCIASGSRDEALAIESAADLVVDLDRVNRAYVAAWAAKKLGASAVVAAYSRDEESDPAALRERAIMEAASAELGLKYAAMIAPKGVEAEAFARAGTGAWLRDYGPRASLYCSDPSLVGPILAGAVAGGGIVVEAAGEATRGAWASALGADLSAAKGDPVKERRLLEKAAAALGLKGRLGVWDSGFGAESARGLGEFAMRVCAGGARKDDIKALAAALDARSGSRLGAAAWIAGYDADPETGVKSANHVLIRQDAYVLGRGYLQSALKSAPPEYFALGSSNGK
jgi:hypothetical protein